MTCVGPILYSGKCVRGRDVRVMDCKACGFIHLHPKPSQEDMDRYYREEYFKTEKPDYESKSGTGSDYQARVDFEKIEAVLRQWCGVAPNGVRVLDFGCGPFAPFCVNWWRLGVGNPFFYGIEPSMEAAEGVVSIFGEGTGSHRVEVFRGWEGVPRRVVPFDAINLSFVLEHIVNPAEALWNCHKYLKLHGLLVLEVPFDWNPLQVRIWAQDGGSDPWWVSSPDHQNYLSPVSVKNLLERVGFEVLEARTTYPVELFILSGQDFRTDPEAGKAVVAHREQLQIAWAENGMSKQTQIGRTFWIVAKKRR